jgi:hypothetical protein
MDTDHTSRADPADPTAADPHSPALLAGNAAPVLPGAEASAADVAGALVPVAPDPDGIAGALSPALQDLHQRAAGYATCARGPGTLRTYRSAWRAYEA